jgi:hypothetical protein
MKNVQRMDLILGIIVAVILVISLFTSGCGYKTRFVPTAPDTITVTTPADTIYLPCPPHRKGHR